MADTDDAQASSNQDIASRSIPELPADWSVDLDGVLQTVANRIMKAVDNGLLPPETLQKIPQDYADKYHDSATIAKKPKEQLETLAGLEKRPPMSHAAGIALQEVFSKQELVRKIFGSFTSPKSLCEAEEVCKDWKVMLRDEYDSPWRALLHTRHPRTTHAMASEVDWGTLDWKERYKKLQEMCPVLLWVDDKYENVSSIQHMLADTHKIPCHHELSTTGAKTWLTTSVASLHSQLAIITDNHRNEKQEDGEVVSNYDAGAQLIEWLNEEGSAFQDVKIMMFCGPGSIPYVRDLSTRYSNVQINTSEYSAIQFAKKYSKKNPVQDNGEDYDS